MQYWNGRGLMEVPRMILAAAGKYPGDYTDGRYENPSGDLSQNLGRMPVIEYNGKTVGQSAAINFFLASELGLMGANTYDAAHIISLHEHLKEMHTAYRSIVPYGQEPTAEGSDKWFDTGATDSTGNAERAGYSTRFLTWFLGRIEESLDNNGFAVGNQLSLADILLYNSLAEHLEDEQAAPEVPQFKREAFGSKARTDAAIAKHPRIQASIRAVAENANIQRWLSTRGVQTF